MVIGKVMPNGKAGSYAYQPDEVIDTHIAGATIQYGQAVKYNSAGQVVPFESGDSASDFVGIALQGVNTPNDYFNQNEGCYKEKDRVAVMKRGCVNVVCNVGSPTLAGVVYIRVTANAEIPTGVVGGIEASADSTNTIALTNVQFKGTKDANNVVAVRILTCNKA